MIVYVEIRDNKSGKVVDSWTEASTIDQAFHNARRLYPSNGYEVHVWKNLY